MIVEQFLAWMPTASPDARVRATAALARAILVSESGDSDYDAMEAALTVLLDDADLEIRRTIAVIMAPAREAPRHVILALAEGPPEVAAIVLEHSPVLIDAELLEFLAEAGETAEIAIASRAWTSPGISVAIAEFGRLSACIALARNLTAAIPAQSLLRLAERFGGDHFLRDAMFARAHLPIEVRHCLLAHWSASLAEFAPDCSWMGDERAKSAANSVKDKITVQMAAAARPEELPAFVEHLRTTGQLTTTLLLRAVTLGDVRFLQEALTLLSGLPGRRVEGLIIEGRESACRALFEKAGLPTRVFPAFLAALDVQRELARELGGEPVQAGDHRFASRVVERVLVKCRNTPAATEDDLIVLLRRIATEAQRDAARALVADLTRRPPLLLAAPEFGPDEDRDGDRLLYGSEETTTAIEVYGEAMWDADLAIETEDYIEVEAVAYPVFADARYRVQPEPDITLDNFEFSGGFQSGAIVYPEARAA